MKYILIYMFLAVSIYANAQIVTIPDANFKAFLLNDPAINTNADGEIQESEALGVTSLTVSSIGLSIFNLTGITSFLNLETLTCGSGQLTELDIHGLAKLKQVNAESNSITSLNVAGCTQLSFINCSMNSLVSASFVGLDSLEMILLNNNALLQNVDAHDCKKLATFSCENSVSLVLADLSNCDSLFSVNFWQCQAQTINASGCDKLKDFSMFGSINNLILKNCTNLETIMGNLGGFGIWDQLDVTGCTKLKSIHLMESALYSLDVSTCPNLEQLSLPHNGTQTPHLIPGMKYLNIKNGSSLSLLEVAPVGNTIETALNICADDFEIAAVNTAFQNVVDDWGAVVNVSTYCSFFPGGNYNTISGKTQLDLGNNGCDISDAAMPNVALRISDAAGNSLIRHTASSGDYAHYPYKGVFTLTPYFPYPYFNIDPITTSVTFDTANNLQATRDFCITPNGTHNDLEINFLPTFPPARPGFNAAYTVTYKNRGTTTLSGNVQLNFDNSRMNFVSASENGTTQSTGQLTWSYNNLLPFESKTINVIFNLLPPPVNNIGDTIIYLAAITPSAGDETQFDNSFILPQRVIGSYDPNDKQCLEGSKLDISKIGDYLHYQIRFQNEGTDTAFYVVVADTLSDKLDWNTFEFIKASHPVEVKLTDNKAEFIFENIKLPYKAINEPASNGWVAFKIKPKPSVVIGDSLNNSAAIYFDFNLPVITNTATTIITNSSTPVPVKLEYFSVNKKENSNQLNWKANCTSTNATFVIERSNDGIYFKSIGNIKADALRCQLPFSFADNKPAEGKNYYRLKITDAEGKSFYSKVLVTGNSKAGLEIKAIANNTIYISSDKQQMIQLKIIAADGKAIYAGSKSVSAGNNSIELFSKNIARGVYTLFVTTNEGETITRKFIQ